MLCPRSCPSAEDNGYGIKPCVRAGPGTQPTRQTIGRNQSEIEENLGGVTIIGECVVIGRQHRIAQPQHYGTFSPTSNKY